MGIMTSPLRYDRHGRAEPLGVRAAAVKMGLIVAAETGGVPLTAWEVRIVTAAIEFLADEYSRISDGYDKALADNRELTQQLEQARARLAERGE
jgi:hypothetical protein